MFVFFATFRDIIRLKDQQHGYAPATQEYGAWEPFVGIVCYGCMELEEAEVGGCEEVAALYDYFAEDVGGGVEGVVGV